LFVSTGATKWDDPKGHPWTMGFFVSYQAEGRIYAGYILKHKPDAKIGVLYFAPIRQAQLRRFDGERYVPFGPILTGAVG